MLLDWDTFDFAFWSISSIVTVVMYSKARSFPYAATGALVLNIILLLFFWRDFTTCPDNDVKRVVSPLTGKLEPPLWGWGCCHRAITTCLRTFGNVGSSIIISRQFCQRLKSWVPHQDEEMNLNNAAVRKDEIQTGKKQ